MSKIFEISTLEPSSSFNACLEYVETGNEECLLTRNSRPVARLVPVARPRVPVRLGDREEVRRAFAALKPRPKTDTWSTKQLVEEGRR
jgi:antitoxin (DNA-binding transcriptional repressor) of toxin-antitoxin stability system